MTNLDKWAQVMKDEGIGINKFNFQPEYCSYLNCANCAINNGSLSCHEYFKAWLQNPYEGYVDWTKVAVDTPIYVRDFSNEEWLPRYFAEYRDGIIYAFDHGATSFTADGMNVSWRCAKLADKENIND